jgi:predicted PurR-regulated permease PerM
MNPPKLDLARIVIAVLGLCGLILAAFWIVRPFLTATVWATLIAVATWPLLLRVQRILWKKRGLAVATMTLALLLVALLPFLAAVLTLVRYGGAVGDFATQLPGYTIPPPPSFLEKVPLVGTHVQGLWREAAAEGTPGLLKKVSPYIGIVAKWFASQVGNFGVLLAQFLLTLVIVAVLYASGEDAVDRVRAVLRRLLGQRGEDLLPLIGGAIRGVAMGVVGTAISQALFSGLGLLIAGVPVAGALTAAMVILCIAQVGPGLVLIPAVIWAYSSLGAGWGTFLLVWSAVAMILDNFIRPVLIKAGVEIPILIVFAGVLGGLMSLGLIGIFVGPVVLAVVRALMNAWLDWRSDTPEADLVA